MRVLRKNGEEHAMRAIGAVPKFGVTVFGPRVMLNLPALSELRIADWLSCWFSPINLRGIFYE